MLRRIARSRHHAARVANLTLLGHCGLAHHQTLHPLCWWKISKTGTTSRLRQNQLFSQLRSYSVEVKDDDGVKESGVITVGELMRNWTERLQHEEVPEAELSVEVLVAHAFGEKMFHELGCNFKAEEVGEEEGQRIDALCQKRLERMPLQYILGEWDFRDMTLKMKPPVFIARPEGEMFVEIISDHYSSADPLRLLEVGCGTGALSIALLRIFQEGSGMAFDGLAEAVQLTKENAERYGVLERLEVYHELITSDVPRVLEDTERLDAIVSNPPYVFHRDMKELPPEISLHEDQLAFDGGVDGSDVIVNILRLSEHILKPGGYIWLETDTRHPEILQEWLKRHPEVPVRFVRSFQDFNDRPRYCQLQYTGVD